MWGCVLGNFMITSGFFGLWLESGYAGVWMFGVLCAYYMITKEGL